MKTSDKLHKDIIKDCEKAMRGATFFHILCESFSGLFAVYTAKVLGDFADNVFHLNVSMGTYNIVKLVLCVGITVIVIPLFGLLGRIVMLNNALIHDRMVLSRFLDKQYEQVIRYEVGDIMYRLEWDPCHFRIYWVEIVEKICVIPVLFIYLLYHTIQIDLLYTGIVFLLSFTRLVLPIMMAKILAKYDQETRQYNTQVRVYETEITEKPEMIKLYGLSQPLIDRLHKLYQNYFQNIFKKSIKLSVIYNHISTYLSTVCMILILFWGAILVAKGTISAGSVVAMTGFFSIFNSLFTDIEYVIKNLPKVRNVIERMVVLYDAQEPQEGLEVESVSGIVGDSISFSYENRDVLRSLSFDIHKGEKTAICGANGSGKTTLIKILSGLITEYQGSLKLDDYDMRALAIHSWRKQFAFVEQDPHLFSGSIKKNIHLGNLQATDQEVAEVMRELDITYLANREVSNMQKGLSGGEKQKISIARALLKHTPFLIMDEPSNNLDKQTLAWLREFIRKTPKTVIYISHDNDLADIADAKIEL